MSDKKRRDITLGEMQDECKNRVECHRPDTCKYYGVCAFENHVSPARVILTDPPRFNEAQMAFLKAFAEIGAIKVQRLKWTTFYIRDEYDSLQSIGAVYEEMFDGLEPTIIYDLAELLGKDAP